MVIIIIITRIDIYICLMRHLRFPRGSSPIPKTLSLQHLSRCSESRESERERETERERGGDTYITRVFIACFHCMFSLRDVVLRQSIWGFDHNSPTMISESLLLLVVVVVVVLFLLLSLWLSLLVSLLSSCLLSLLSPWIVQTKILPEGWNPMLLLLFKVNVAFEVIVGKILLG